MEETKGLYSEAVSKRYTAKCDQIEINSKPMSDKSPALLELRGVTKRYPSVIANRNINLHVMPGEIHAVLGENGAGKSTLMKIIYGLVTPDSGLVLWNGKPTMVRSPAQARRLGIGMVFQHFSLFETLTVCENIALALSHKPRLRQLAPKIAEVSTRYGMPLNPTQRIYNLSVGERQRVEIIRCLLQAPRLLIMDEPTSVLTPQASQKLFETLQRLASDGVSILFISHKLHEIQALCDRATILRGGEVSGSVTPREETTASLARMMIGKELPKRHHPPLEIEGLTRLEVRKLCSPANAQFETALQDISLELRSGELTGLAGISGNGQQELLERLSGERLSDANTITLDGQAIGKLGPAERRNLGLVFVPEERLGRGAVPEMNLADNSLLTGSRLHMVQRGWIRHGVSKAFSAHCIDTFKVMCSGPSAIAKSLSGGNLQKFIVGREVLQAPKVLIAAQPTWGVDVGAANAIRQALIDLRSAGAAVLVISEELEELFEICDRIAVIAQGKVSPLKHLRDTNIEQVGLWMGGVFDHQPQTNLNAH